MLTNAKPSRPRGAELAMGGRGTAFSIVMGRSGAWSDGSNDCRACSAAICDLTIEDDDVVSRSDEFDSGVGVVILICDRVRVSLA